MDADNRTEPEKPTTNQPPKRALRVKAVQLTVKGGRAHITKPTAAPPADKNPALVYLAGLGVGSRPVQHRALDNLAALLSGGRTNAVGFPWGSVEYQHVVGLRSRLVEHLNPATVNRYLSALRGVLRNAWLLGFMSAETYQRAVSVPNVSVNNLPAGRELSAGELVQLFTACERDETPSGARDAALLALLYGGGLRRAEAVALDLADYEPETGKLTIRRSKRGRSRTCYADNGAADALAAWVAVRGSEPGALLHPIRKNGVIERRRLTPQGVYAALRARAALTSVRDFSPHDLRRTCITHLLEAGADVLTVQNVVGHENPRTTARYDRRGERAKQSAARLLHVPFHARG